MRRNAVVFVAILLAGFSLTGKFLVRANTAGKPTDDGARATTDCDRKCLYGFVDQYLAALVAREPGRLPWAKTVRFTENNVELQIGDGLWGTITALGTEDFRAADADDGQVEYYGVADERGAASFLALRLRVEDHKISEVETIVDRKGYGPGPFGDPAALKPVPVLVEGVAPEHRTLRARMIALADGYFNTLQLNDGAIFTQFADDCSRRENGVWTANDPHPDPNSNYSVYGKISCEQGFKLGNYRWDDRLRARRFPLVDEEKGLVLAGGFIDHAGTLITYTTA